MFAGDPRSPLVLLFFAAVASAPLRLSLKLVYFATAAAMIGYLLVLGHYAWIQIGFHRYYATPELRIPRRHEIIVLLALLVCGLLAGQAVRQMKRLVLRSVTAVEPPEAA
jgi:TRAP-type C4-dicarboxylate transport system permease small subunit